MSSTGTTPSEDLRNEVARIKKLLGLDVNRLAIGSDIEGVIAGSPFGPMDFTINGVSPISFVNVTTTIGPSQTGGIPGDTTPPGQTTGLTANAISSSQINLAWNSNPAPDLANYNVYRGTSAGFPVTLGVTSPVGTPSTNSYSDTGRTASTTYYYKVSAVDTSNNIGALSTEANATTLPAAAFPPSLELHLETNFTDTSANSLSVLPYMGSAINGFSTGQFGNGWLCNTPITPGGVAQKEGLVVTNAVPIQMDTSVGFSFSCWINPVDITAAPGFRRFLVAKVEDANNFWSLELDSTSMLYFFVTKAGTTFKREIAITTSSLQHIAATFNGATNTVALYRNAVAGSASTAAFSTGFSSVTSDMYIGIRYANVDSTYFEGMMDELRYYKSIVLTPAQVTNLKNTNAP